VTAGVGVDTSVMQAQFDILLNDVVRKCNEYTEEQKAIWEAFFQSVEDDTLVPVPGVGDAGKIVIVNASGNGYLLADQSVIAGVSQAEMEDYINNTFLGGEW
jgi:hypothetical protein